MDHTVVIVSLSYLQRRKGDLHVKYAQRHKNVSALLPKQVFIAVFAYCTKNGS